MALVLASAFGLDTGDFAAHDLHLGHALGLIPLAVVFGAILFAEARSCVATESFHLFIITTMRTAATNLADPFDHDSRISPLLVIAVLAVAPAALVLTDRGAFSRLRGTEGAVPAMDARCRTTMPMAGVLGGAPGDFCADDLGLDAGLAATVNLAILVALLGRAPGFGVKALYWITTARVRTAGTTVGDWLTSRHGLGLGLALSTTLTGLAFGALVAPWRPRPVLAGLRAA